MPASKIGWVSKERQMPGSEIIKERQMPGSYTSSEANA